MAKGLFLEKEMELGHLQDLQKKPLLAVLLQIVFQMAKLFRCCRSLKCLSLSGKETTVFFLSFASLASSDATRRDTIFQNQRLPGPEASEATRRDAIFLK